MKLSRQLLGFLTIVLILALLATGIYFRIRPEPEATAQESSTEGTAAAALPASAAEQFATEVPQPVVGAFVVQDTLWITVKAAGEAAWARGTTINSEVQGVIRSLPVRENLSVGAGDVLLQVDTTEYALALARAQGDLVQAQARFQEMTLFDETITDPAVREERTRLARARSGLVGAEVGLREAELNFERTTVRAPFEGRVANLRVVEGQRVNAGAELMTIVDLDPIKVEAQVLDPQIGLLAEGRLATVTFAAFPGESFSGRVASINPIVDAELRTSRVTVLLSNPQGRIKPGMYANVALEAQYFPNKILVPRSAILEKDRREMLFVYEDGRAKWRYVTTGLGNDEQVEIVPNEETSMVEPGEMVLVDNHYYLTHDARIEVVDTVTAGPRGGGQ